MADQAEATKTLANIQKKNALVDNLINIPPFNGESSATALWEFTDKLESFSQLFGWDEEEQKFALMNRVSGNAAKLIKLHKEKSVKDILKVLENRYKREETPDIALSKFMNFKQQPGMPVQEYFDRSSDLSLRALVVDGVDKIVAEKSRKAMLHSMLLGNLLPEIRKGVISKDPKNPEEILTYALLEEKAINSINPFYSMSSEQIPQSSHLNAHLSSAAATLSKNYDAKRDREIEDLKQKLDLLTAKIESLVVTNQNGPVNRDERRPPYNNFVCFCCGQQGMHLTRNCPFQVAPQPYYAQNQRGANNNRGRGNYENNRQNYANRGDYNQRSSRGGNYTNRRGNFRGRSDHNNIDTRGDTNTNQERDNIQNTPPLN